MVNRSLDRVAPALALFILTPYPQRDAQKADVQRSEYTVRSEVDLLSVAVRVTDRNDNEIHGLTADQFSRYEDDRRRKIALFNAADAPTAERGNEKLQPRPYESKVTTKNGCTVYRDDFQEVSSGWPNKRNCHYKTGAYEIVNVKLPAGTIEEDASPAGQSIRVLRRPYATVSGLDGVLVANGPPFGDLNASVTVEWKSTGRRKDLPAAAGLVFHLDDHGYYAVLVSRETITPAKPSRRAFKLVEKFHREPRTRDLLPWTELPLADQLPGKDRLKISVQSRGPVIKISVQDTPVAKFEDEESDFRQGIVGMVLFGEGNAVFRDLLAEEVHCAGVELPLSHGPGAN